MRKYIVHDLKTEKMKPIHQHRIFDKGVVIGPDKSKDILKHLLCIEQQVACMAMSMEGHIAHMLSSAPDPSFEYNPVLLREMLKLMKGTPWNSASRGHGTLVTDLATLEGQAGHLGIDLNQHLDLKASKSVKRLYQRIRLGYSFSADALAAIIVAEEVAISIVPLKNRMFRDTDMPHQYLEHDRLNEAFVDRRRKTDLVRLGNLAMELYSDKDFEILMKEQLAAWPNFLKFLAKKAGV